MKEAQTENMYYMHNPSFPTKADPTATLQYPWC